MKELRYLIVYLFMTSLSDGAAFSSPFTGTNPRRQHASLLAVKVPTTANLPNPIGRVARGGDQTLEQEPMEREILEAPIQSLTVSTPSSSGIASVSSFFTMAMNIYGTQLDKFPILTKSLTAGLIFGLSDYIAQKVERSKLDKSTTRHQLNGSRLRASILIGLLYFGPAAHYWYDWMYDLFPGRSIWSTVQKAFWGQVVFGPSFTCLFFASSLLQAGNFSVSNWGRKIKADLPGAWLAGSGFWPLVDMVSYSLVPVKMIPLFINMCSLVWTVYLSVVANKQTTPPKEQTI